METTSVTSLLVTELILLICFLIPAIFFVLTQYNSLKLIRPENRRLHPALVWLQFIPVLGQIWQFVVVARLSSSIRLQWQAADEHSILGISAEAIGGTGKPTLGIGIAYCSLYVLGVCLNLFSRAGLYMIAGLLVIASMICWIIYWVQLAGWKRRLKQRVPFAVG